jgi:hypothetical protein
MSEILKELGDGLILRRSTKEDAEALAAFNSKIHADDEFDGKALAAWTHDLMSGEHPNFGVGDFTVVEDSRDHRIISTMNLISQTWTYEGIPFGVGRPELVGTLEEYRRRGLIGEQFNIIHQWSAERGELVQAITGIPYYYRRFGYEMALNLDGGRAGYAPNVIPLKEGESEPYHLREARENDLVLVAHLYEIGCGRSLIAAKWDVPLWQYELSGKQRYDINGRRLFIIEDEADLPVGFVAVPGVKWHNMIAITAYELMPGVSWFKVTPSVVRWLWKLGEEQAKEQSYSQEAFGFWLGEEHPVYTAYADRLPRVREPYTWFLRVPDLVKFLQVITPALERHLEGSLVGGYSGEFKLSFYHTGIGMHFEKGKILEIKKLVGDELAKGTEGKECSAAFPDLTFLQVLFGWRSVDEVRHLFPDCGWRNSEVKTLLETLFPRKSSNLWPIS